MTKSELRRIFLAKQRGLSPEERVVASERICKGVFECVDIDAVGVLHCFISIEKFNEIDTSPIFEHLWTAHPRVRTVVPRIETKTGEMVSVPFSTDSSLVSNHWDIREPDSSDAIDPLLIDLVLVPLVACDRQGHRVGYGKGFYDRFLKRCRSDCLKIGLSYFDPVDQIEDAAEHDVRLDLFVTPKGCERPIF